ncbi:Calpain-3 [Wickerhamomyces ciferrii]|uniref:Calpain-3 n=1 Tax=Wickerhamomyces ciferrii (strain ATCC 14091 / BCRC 22168 / CBS 111 / JCM 3599 / NBRC 0793 / NRRL Y-1031 F-60-10) TaxID=1206466 RepID=K0KWJ3_WICCF|nr:Calpain-3 [Wickerhamomyces ciferrii]CCH45508.1 Calpain-3 [Wickerhamomyces ciferrii]
MEAFGARQQPPRPVRKAPGPQSLPAQRTHTPPLHPQQPPSQHPRPIQQRQQFAQVGSPPIQQNQNFGGSHHSLPLNPRQQQQLQQHHHEQSISQSRPSLAGFPHSNQPSYVDEPPARQQQPPQQQQYSGYAPSAYEHLQQRNSSQPQVPSPKPLPQQVPAVDPAQILERQLRDLFDRVDKSRDGRLREDELATALINNDGTQFNPSTVKLMVRLFDKDGSGTIEFKEFFHLWNYILHWRKTFQRFDIDGNQRISFGEYQSALESFGYRLPTDIVLFIFQRFGEFNNSKPMSLKFDMFVESLVWLLRCTNVFKKFDTQGNGIATISFQDFVHEILSFI